ncbi:MAG TPA: RidA family protein [Burkholderiales bacterium]|nr:RidA family protein [Burkholderiales bacterium]
MKKEFFNPTELRASPFYTHAVSVTGGRLIYVAGQVAYDRDGKVVGKGDMRAQSEQVFANVTHALRAAGATWDNVIKMNGYMVGLNPAAVDAYREVRSRYLKSLPASTLVGVDRLVEEDLLLEVEVIAAVD